MEALITKPSWTQVSNQDFWGEIAPCEHILQIYENDEVFLDLLFGFVSGGLNAGDSIIVIASETHLKGLNHRLNQHGYHVPSLISKRLYICLDANETLSKFMVGDWPDERLFNQVVSKVISKAKQNGQQVRAFGEMVAILWAMGNVDATIRLEHLWNKFCESEFFSLFCAYPKSGFTQDATQSVMHICQAHSRLITGTGKGKTDLFYKNINRKKTP
jgi:hypothetical protein